MYSFIKCILVFSMQQIYLPSLIIHINTTSTYYSSQTIYMNIKSNMSMKSYHILHPLLGFQSTWVDRVMTCVTSVRYTIRFNGVVSTPFTPTRGLRQGD